MTSHDYGNPPISATHCSSVSQHDHLFSSWGSLVHAVPAIPPQPQSHQNEIRRSCCEGIVENYRHNSYNCWNTLKYYTMYAPEFGVPIIVKRIFDLPWPKSRSRNNKKDAVKPKSSRANWPGLINTHRGQDSNHIHPVVVPVIDQGQAFIFLGDQTWLGLYTYTNKDIHVKYSWMEP